MRKIIVFPIIVILLLSASYAYFSSNHGEPSGGEAQQEPEHQDNTEIPRSRSAIVKEVVAPPFLEIQHLYNTFPIVIKSSKNINISNISIYARTAKGDTYRLIITRHETGQSQEATYTSLRVKLPHGYYPPGNLTIIVVLPDGYAQTNTTILGPPKYNDTLPGEVTLAGSRVTIEWPPTAGTPVQAFVADCQPGTYQIAPNPARLEVELGEQCPPGETHTLVVGSLVGGDTVFYVAPIP